MSRSCVECKHWYWDAGSPGYSEYTPGDNWESFCKKEHWRAHGTRETQQSWAAKLLTARTCPDFELADYANQSP